MDRRERDLLAALSALRILGESVTVRSMGDMVRRITGRGVHLEYVRGWLKAAGKGAQVVQVSDTEFVLKKAEIDTSREPKSVTLFPLPRNPKYDAAAHAILSECWPVVERAGVAFTAPVWFSRNRVAAKDLHLAGRAPLECARMLALAIDRGGQYYGGIRMLVKLQENWGAIAALDEPRDDGNRVQRADLS